MVPKERTVSLVILERTEDLGGGYYTEGPKHSSIPLLAYGVTYVIPQVFEHFLTK